MWTCCRVISLARVNVADELRTRSDTYRQDQSPGFLPQGRYRDAITPRRSQAKLCHVRSRFAIVNPNPKTNRFSRNLKHWWHSNTRAQHSNGGPKAGTS